MPEHNDLTDAEVEVYPVEPRYHPVHAFTRRMYNIFASAKLAMFLLVAILVSCLTGTTVFRGEKAWQLIFTSLWFNGLLILLIINVACCFFGRVWGRRVTLISLGMILFHLSFVTMFIGVVYNSFYYFRGAIRLTEGETLPSGDLNSYDSVDHGRFFNISRLKGETSLIKMNTKYMVDGKNKRNAYQIAVGEGLRKKEGIIYLTQSLEHKGYSYFPDREGYSTLAVLYDKTGKELFGAHVPLQSLRVNEKEMNYTTGTKTGAALFPFPQQPEKPAFNLNISYRPNLSTERSGDVFFQIWPLEVTEMKPDSKPLVSANAKIGDKADIGKYDISVREIRYWVMMTVRYEPGKPIVLTSLWVGLFGVTLTTLARMFKKKQSGSASV